MVKIYSEFILFTVLIIYFGFKLSQYGQIISRKRFISEALFGVIFLAIVTSLPEVIASIGSVTIVDAPNMATSAAIGSILFNLMILALLDLIQGKGSILSESNRSHVLTASLTIMMLGLISLSLIQRTITNVGWGFMHVGYESFLLILIYVLSTRALYKNSLGPGNLKDKKLEKVYPLWIKFIISAIIVIISGFSLAKLGKDIALMTGMSDTFVGLVFLAVVTSLPELIVSISALRLGSVDMAVGNILGSNFFDTIIVPITDIFYVKAQLLSTISSSHIFTLTLCMVFSAIVISGLIYRSKKTFLRLGWDIIAIITIFALSIFFFYHIK